MPCTILYYKYTMFLLCRQSSVEFFWGGNHCLDKAAWDVASILTKKINYLDSTILLFVPS